MAIDYDIDPEKNIVFVRIYDAINIEDIKEAFAKIQSDAQSAEGMTALVDAREVRRAFFIREMNSLLEVLASRPAGFVERYGFIVASNVAFGLGRRFHFKALRSGLKLAIFRDLGAALEWYDKSPRNADV